MILTPTAWHHSVSSNDSIFVDTYKKTREHVKNTALDGGHDVIIELLCDTGDIIGQLDLNQIQQQQQQEDEQRDNAAASATAATISGSNNRIECYGLDTNPDNIKFCQEEHRTNLCEFFVLPKLLDLKQWYDDHLAVKGYKKPLVVCVNNALNNNVSNHEIRSSVVEQMLAIAGSEGMCMLGYFNGTFFSHAVMNYYKKNQDSLFGPNYNVLQHANMEKRQLIIPRRVAPSLPAYGTNDSPPPTQETTTTAAGIIDYGEYHNDREWYLPHEVQQCLRSYDVDVPKIFESFGTTTAATRKKRRNPRKYNPCHILCDDLAIFVWFNQESTSHAKTYYDNDDSQKFYRSIWGSGDTFHLGQYDDSAEVIQLGEESGDGPLPTSLIEGPIPCNINCKSCAESGGTPATIDDASSLSSFSSSLSSSSVLSRTQERIQQAQTKHERDFIQLIKEKCYDSEQQSRLRIIDFGCGYGGLLRHIYQDPSKMIWSAIGCDISRKNCNEAKRRNEEQLGLQGAKDVQIVESSFLDLNGIVKNQSMDLVVSMDAFIHVGNKERQFRAIQEASRILCPGGYLIFTDIMQKPQTKKKKNPPKYGHYGAGTGSDSITDDELRSLYDRLQLHEMGTVQNYKTAMVLSGFTDFEFINLSKNVSIHFDCILQVLREKTESCQLEFSTPEYKEKMERGLRTWKELAPEYIEWGFIIGRKSW